MTDNRTIELLCKLLDERGENYVHDEHTVTWSYYTDPHTATESMDGTLIVTGLTPEQAIAATLGSGTCEMETDWDCLCNDIPGAPEDTWAYKCSACEWSFRYDRGIVPNFCPNCGKVVER